MKYFITLLLITVSLSSKVSAFQCSATPCKMKILITEKNAHWAIVDANNKVLEPTRTNIMTTQNTEIEVITSNANIKIDQIIFKFPAPVGSVIISNKSAPANRGELDFSVVSNKINLSSGQAQDYSGNVPNFDLSKLVNNTDVEVFLERISITINGGTSKVFTPDNNPELSLIKEGFIFDDLSTKVLRIKFNSTLPNSKFGTIGYLEDEDSDEFEKPTDLSNIEGIQFVGDFSSVTSLQIKTNVPNKVHSLVPRPVPTPPLVKGVAFIGSNVNQIDINGNTEDLTTVSEVKINTIPIKDAGSEEPKKDEQLLELDEINFLPTGFSDDSPKLLKLPETKTYQINIMYDFISGKPVYLNSDGDHFNFWKLKVYDKKRIRLGVGRHVSIYALNMNTEKDSLGVNVKYEDLHTEDADTFSKGLESLVPTETIEKEEDEDDSTSDENQDIQSGQLESAKELTFRDKNILNKYKKLSNQLKEYYEKKIGGNYVDASVYHKEIREIRNKISDQLNLLNVTSGTIKKKAEEFIDSRLKEEALNDIRKELQTNASVASEYWNLINSSLVFHVASFQVENKDITNIELSKYSNKKLISKIPKTLTFYNKGGAKIDFSSGIFITGLIDHSFTTQNVTAIDTSITETQNEMMETVLDTTISEIEKDKILRDDTGDVDFGAGMLAHVYIRTGLRFDPALSFGFTINNDIATRLLTGVSVILGKKRRVILSYGASLGKVKRLATGLAENDIIDIGEGQTSAIPTKEVWKNSWFAGLTWNF